MTWEELFKFALQLAAFFALLGVGITLIRLAKEFVQSDIPAPFNTDLATFKKDRRWRDWSSLVIALVGAALLVSAVVYLFRL